MQCSCTWFALPTLISPPTDRVWSRDKPFEGPLHDPQSDDPLIMIKLALEVGCFERQMRDPADFDHSYCARLRSTSVNGFP